MLKSLCALGARFAIVPIFLAAAIDIVKKYAVTVSSVGDAGLPYAEVLVPAALALLALGSLSVLLGWKTRIGAFLLIACLVTATVLYRDFWNLEGASRAAQQVEFLRNLGLLGGLLALLAFGPGGAAIDRPADDWADDDDED